jgi:phosphatidate cytidylyltransferase
MLKQRVITALVLVTGLLVALLWFPQWAWLALVSAICAVGAWEWGGLAALGGRIRIAFSLGAGVLALGLGFAGGLGGFAGQTWILVAAYLSSVVLWFAFVPLWLRSGWAVGTRTAMLVGIIVLVPSALAMAQLRAVDAMFMLFALVLVWVADIAAYFSGRAFGRNKLAPSVSPGKTWEGALGALIGVVACGIAGYSVLFSEPPGIATLAWLIPLLAAYTALSIIGDLFESLVKRKAGAKDSGTLLPGHGGVLDRIDSLTSTLPVAGLILVWLH